MPDYQIRITTPADFSGLQGIKPQLADVEAAVKRASAASVQLKNDIQGAFAAQQAREQSKQREPGFENAMASVDAGIAQERASVEAAIARQQAQKARFANIRTTANAREEAGVYGSSDGKAGAASSAGLGAFLATARTSIPVIAGVAAGLKVLTSGFSEFAENEQAEITLRKFGVSAADAAKNAELVEQLELFTGDKVAAAELYGRVINGNTRALEQYGVQLADGATKQDRLAALQVLAARGVETQNAKAQTLTGSLAILGKGVAQATGDFLSWGARVTGVTGLLQGLNKALGFTKSNADASSASVAEFNKKLSATPTAAQQAAVAARQAAAAFDDVRDRAEAATQKVDTLQSILSKAEKAPSEEDLEKLRIDAAEADGASPIDVAEMRRDQAAKRAEQQRNKDAEMVNRQKAESADALKKLDELETSNRSSDSSKRRGALEAKARSGSPAREADMTQLNKLQKEAEKLEADREFWKNQPVTRGSQGALGRNQVALDKNRLSRQTISDRIGSGPLTAEEQEELAALRKQKEVEQASINEQRRKAIKAREEAEAVERGLPKRREAADLRKKIQDAEIEKLKGEREMKRAQTTEEMQSMERQRALDAENQSGEEKERGTKADKAINETLDTAGKKFTEKHGKGKLASEALKDARAAAMKRLHEMTAEEATDSADKVFEEEVNKVTRPDGKGGERKLRGREFQSAADQKGSPLDQYKELQKKDGGDLAAPGKEGPGKGAQQGGASSLQQAAKAAGSAAADAKAAQQLAANLQALQREMAALKAKVDAIDTSSSK